MPVLVQPPEMPEEVSAIIDAIGNRIRAALLHALAQNSPQSAVQLAPVVGAHHVSVHRHLRELELVGLVHADAAMGVQRGQTILWTIDRDQVDAYIATWHRYLTGK